MARPGTRPPRVTGQAPASRAGEEAVNAGPQSRCAGRPFKANMNLSGKRRCWSKTWNTGAYLRRLQASPSAAPRRPARLCRDPTCAHAARSTPHAGRTRTAPPRRCRALRVSHSSSGSHAPAEAGRRLGRVAPVLEGKPRPGVGRHHASGRRQSRTGPRSSAPRRGCFPWHCAEGGQRLV